MILPLALAAALTTPAQGQEPVPAEEIVEEDAPPLPVHTDTAILSNGGEATGRMAVNVASGNNNQQANVGVIASGDTAIAGGALFQSIHSSGPLAGNRTARIEGDAFAGMSGMIAVNVVAGSDNQQANLAVFALGFEGAAVTDATLGQARASHEPTGATGEDTEAPEIATGISQGAFQGSSGLVQVNLIGGERNSSANVFALTVAGGAEP
jgi:hypothetical protein